MNLVLLAMDPNAETPSWIPIVAFAIPVAIVLAVLIPALRKRKGYKRARSHERSARQESDTVLGSAAAIDDPSGYSTEALLKAMAVVEPDYGPDAEANLPFNEGWAGNMLGLKDKMSAASEVLEPNVYWGERHGRQVFVRVGPDEKIEGGTTMMSNRHIRQITVLRVNAPLFTLAVPDGRPVATDGGTPELDGLLGTLGESETVWADLRATAGPEGIVLHRPVITAPGFWIYDLWLAERIAERLNLQPLAAKRIGPAWKVPYGLGRDDEPDASR